MKELVFSTVITDHKSTDNETNLFLIGIDCRRRQGQIPVTKVTFGYMGVSSFVKVPADIVDMVFNPDVLKDFIEADLSWEKDDKECNLIQSIHYNFTSPDGCVNISYFEKDRRTVINVRIGINDLIRAGFLNFDCIEDEFNNHLNRI